MQRCPAGAEVQVQRSCRAVGVSTGAGADAGAGVKVQRCKDAVTKFKVQWCKVAKVHWCSCGSAEMQRLCPDAQVHTGAAEEVLGC